MEHGHPNERSGSSRMVARMTAGSAKRIIAAEVSIGHATVGLRSSISALARVLSTPTMISIAPAMAEISMKPIPSSQKSAPMPGEYSAPVSGGYMNQPPDGAAPKKSVLKKTRPPTKYAQKAKAPRRGKGRS